MESDQKSKTPSSLNQAHRKRPVTGVSTKHLSSSRTIIGTADHISRERNGFHGPQGKPKSGHTPRPKEVGKVMPMRILPEPLDNSEEEFDKKAELRKNQQNSMTDPISQDETKEDEDDLSLIEEGYKHSDGLDMIKQPSIDPTKDFYSTTGRPVSPALLQPKPDTLQDQPSNLNDADGSNNKRMDSKDQEPSKDEHVLRGIKVIPNLQSKPSKGQSSAGESSERVKVIVRSRPISEKEMTNGHECVVLVHPERNEVEVRRPKSSSGSSVGDTQDLKLFAFDSVYDSRISQMELYDEAFRPLVDSVLEGFNGTIFAYGQTGTGKTYTMEGIREKESEQGVIPNAFRHIFSQVAENSAKQYLIRASYLEIYQEEIRDLLSKDRKQHRELRESPNCGVYVKDLSTYLCSNFSEINDLMTRGNKNRAVGATNMNEHSSRSHAIFMITIEMSEKWSDGRNHFKVGKLNLVDLAGSERQGKTGAVGERLKEATKINLSLSALGNVIAALVDGKSTHIPYRDSKLTRLLQDSLGGNSRTIMVATIGPASFNWDETITTLRYASRAKKIKNKPKVNEDPKDALLRQYQEEIERLRVELERKKAKQALMLQTSRTDSLDRRSRTNKSRTHTASSTASDSSSTTSDLQRQVEEQRLKELAPLLEPYGLDPTTEPHIIMEKLAERRKELLQDNLTMKVEKDALLKKLDETESLVRNTEDECSTLNERIRWLESKVLTGGKDLVDHTNEQQKLIQAKQLELAEQMERYEEMKKKMEEEELTIEELRVNAEAFEADLQAKAKKYKKVNQKLQAIKDEIERTHEDHTTNMRELETVLLELNKEFSLKKMIIENFIPPASRKVIEKRIVWNEEEQEYKLAPLDSSNAILRPHLNRNMKLPLFNLSETGVVHRIDNVHFSDENILQLHPEMPKRRTKTYVPPSTDPYISSLILRAIDDAEKDLSIDCTHLSKKRTTTAKIPQQSIDYFKMGENLIRRVKSARPVSRPGELQQLQFRDFAIVSPSHSIPSSYSIAPCRSLQMLSPTSSETGSERSRPSPQPLLIKSPSDPCSYPHLSINTNNRATHRFQC